MGYVKILDQYGDPINDSNPLPVKQLNNFYLDVALGNIEGFSLQSLLGENPDMQAGVQETIWDQGGIHIKLSTDTQLYISSSNALDDQFIQVPGLDSSYNQISRLAQLDGQNQVALNGDMFRVLSAIVTDVTEPLGDIYISEEATGGDLVGGVPQTVSKIKSKITQGNNLTSNGFYTVPLGKTVCGIKSYYITGKGADVLYKVRFNPPGGISYNNGNFPVYQRMNDFFAEDVCIPEKYDFEIRGITDNPGTFGTTVVIFLLRDNPL